MYLHFTANLQGYLIFMCRFAPYVKNGTNCYGTITYIGKRTKTKKVWICYFMSWLDIPRFQKTTNTIYRSNNLWSKYKCLFYILAIWSSMKLLLSRQIVSKNLVAFRKKIYKNKTMVHMHLQMSLIFSCKTKVQITKEVENLAYSSNVTKTNLWWFVEYKISSILLFEKYLLYIYVGILMFWKKWYYIYMISFYYL